MKNKSWRFIPCSIVLILFLSGCFERTSEEPIEAYTYWAGGEPDSFVTVLHGKYWQSPHWTKEYVTFLHLKASQQWITEFIKQNHLIECKKWTLPSNDPSNWFNTPEWFTPPTTAQCWQLSGYSQGSLYFVDSLHQEVFIYDIQL